MKISVCFKNYPDYGKISGNEWKNNSVPDFSMLPLTIGYYDEGALETALNLKDELEKNKQSAELEAITIGKVDMMFASKLFKLGFANIIEINGDENVENYSLIKCAKILAKYYSDNTPDIILFGKMSEPFESGALHYYLAKELDVSVISNITHFSTSLKGEIIINAQSKKKIEKYEYKRLFVGIVENAKYPYLRKQIDDSDITVNEVVKCSICTDSPDTNLDGCFFESNQTDEHSCKIIGFDAAQLINSIKEA